MLANRITPPPRRRLSRFVRFPGYPSVSREPNLHKHLRMKVLEAMRLTNTKQADIVERTGIPKSTLSMQLQTGRFDVEVLWKVARALSRDVSWFFPDHRARKMTPERAQAVLARMEAAIDWGKRGG